MHVVNRGRLSSTKFLLLIPSRSYSRIPLVFYRSCPATHIHTYTYVFARAFVMNFKRSSPPGFPRFYDACSREPTTLSTTMSYLKFQQHRPAIFLGHWRPASASQRPYFSTFLKYPNECFLSLSLTFPFFFISFSLCKEKEIPPNLARVWARRFLSLWQRDALCLWFLIEEDGETLNRDADFRAGNLQISQKRFVEAVSLRSVNSRAGKNMFSASATNTLVRQDVYFQSNKRQRIKLQLHGDVESWSLIRQIRTA